MHVDLDLCPTVPISPMVYSYTAYTAPARYGNAKRPGPAKLSKIPEEHPMYLRGHPSQSFSPRVSMPWKYGYSPEHSKESQC